MLGPDQLRRWVDHFGAPESQVRRDHLISHVLLHLPSILPAATFFGGTALCRTHLPDFRLSEDVDLLVESSGHAIQSFDDRLAGALAREYPGTTLAWSRDGATTIGTVSVDDLSIRIQLVPLDSSYRRYPSALTPVALRYEDLPQTTSIICPTRYGAAAMKINAWAERRAARDLCDLYGLLQAGALTHDTVRIARTASAALQKHSFDDASMPSSDVWRSALGHQMRELPDPRHVFDSVRSAIADLESWAD